MHSFTLFVRASNIISVVLWKAYFSTCTALKSYMNYAVYYDIVGIHEKWRGGAPHLSRQGKTIKEKEKEKECVPDVVCATIGEYDVTEVYNELRQNFRADLGITTREFATILAMRGWLTWRQLSMMLLEDDLMVTVFPRRVSYAPLMFTDCIIAT
jgi:hypothetical protein